MIIHTNIKQRSDEWFALRSGIPTASDANKILTPTGKLSAQSKGFINELIAESLGYGDPPMEPTEHMIRGTELEPEARALYEFESGKTVQQVGFITNDEKTAGCSPDGVLDLDTLPIGWECKCPKASTHIGYLLGGELPAYYKPQVHFSMAVSGIRRWIFMSYFPGLDPLIVPVEWDSYTDAVVAAIDGFVADLAKARAELGLDEMREAA